MTNRANSSYPLGGIVMIEKVEKEFGLFSKLFSGIEGGAKDFIPLTKLFVHNKLTPVSVPGYSRPILKNFQNSSGWEKRQREPYIKQRGLTRISEIFEMYQDFKEWPCRFRVDNRLFLDLCGSNRAELAEFGYSHERDKRPDKK